MKQGVVEIEMDYLFGVKGFYQQDSQASPKFAGNQGTPYLFLFRGKSGGNQGEIRGHHTYFFSDLIL